LRAIGDHGARVEAVGLLGPRLGQRLARRQRSGDTRVEQVEILLEVEIAQAAGQVELAERQRRLAEQGELVLVDVLQAREDVVGLERLIVGLAVEGRIADDRAEGGVEVG
jgi:hypothetical protein